MSQNVCVLHMCFILYIILTILVKAEFPKIDKKIIVLQYTAGN